MKRFGAFNDWLAIWVTKHVSTMACVYAFLLWSVLPLFMGGFADMSFKDLVLYVSAGILQLVFLPLILVGQAKLNEASDKRAELQFAAVMEMIGDVREDHAALKVILVDVQEDHAATHDVVEDIRRLVARATAR